MSVLFQNRRKSSDSKLNVKFLSGIGALFLLTAVALWYWLDFTSSQTVQSDDGENGKSKGRQVSERSSRRMAANKIREQLLETEKKLRSKYKNQKRRPHRDELPDKEKAYRSWRDKKEQTERYYERFKDDVTNNPNSVKLQMKKTLKEFDDDRAIR